MSSKPDSFLIVGGGLVGLSTALKLFDLRPNAQMTVLEKESAPGQHQSTHNSGVLHCGLYYKPGSLKARMAVEGIREMTSFCRQYEIPHEICGKVVVATSAPEQERLKSLHERGIANGLRGLRLLSRDDLRVIEPHVEGLGALLVPDEGIVDYARVVATMARLIGERGGHVVTSAKVLRLSRASHGWVAHTVNGDYEGTTLINCAGLHCDRVAWAAGMRPDVQIVPFRGEYFRLKPERESLVRNLVYPVPDPQYPFLGVHFTRLIGGGVECGPNAVLALSREGYRWNNINLRDLSEVAAFRGFWNFLVRHRAEVWREISQSLSKKLFCRALQRLIPEITEDDLGIGGAGVRAQAMSSDGDLVQDFVLQKGENALHVLNAPSPAATASLAIGHYVVEQLRL